MPRETHKAGRLVEARPSRHGAARNRAPDGTPGNAAKAGRRDGIEGTMSEGKGCREQAA
ncbi:MAG: hypothetical protein LBG06_02940 [Deltaproteobacteria bacterium]|nr:hypothetical protein [Deltaproteobacteria bacterium]